MKIIGTTPDGCQITAARGGETVTETPAERDARLEEAAYEAVRAAGPELLQALTGLLAVVEAMEKFIDLTPDDEVARDYALTIVRKVNPDHGKTMTPPGPKVIGW